MSVATQLEPMEANVTKHLTMYDDAGVSTIRMTAPMLGKLNHAICQARSAGAHEFQHEGKTYRVIIDIRPGVATAHHEPVDGELTR